MTVTNTTDEGDGIHMINAKVELFDVTIKGCTVCALIMPDSTSETTFVATRSEFADSEFGALIESSLTSATFNDCVFNDNSGSGIFVSDKATLHLHREATAIHSNAHNGIIATKSGKVIIHLPSHHNTTYNNGGQDRSVYEGGTITNVED